MNTDSASSSNPSPSPKTISRAFRRTLNSAEIEFRTEDSGKLLLFMLHGTVSGEWRIIINDVRPGFVAWIRLPITIPAALLADAHHLASDLNLAQDLVTWAVHNETAHFEMRLSRTVLAGDCPEAAAQFCLEAAATLFDGAAPWLAQFALGAIPAETALGHICAGHDPDVASELGPALTRLDRHCN
jgi:hypothetical protein